MSVLVEVARRRVVFADCNARRVMHHSAYFRLFEIGRAELFRRLGHPFPEYIERGEYLAVFDAGCRYRRPVLYDDEVVVRAGATQVGRVWVRIDYELGREDTEVLATGFTSLAAVDLNGNVQRIPIPVREALRAGPHSHSNATSITPSRSPAGRSR
jgi:acyl-CoA thioester hydrolase